MCDAGESPRVGEVLRGQERRESDRQETVARRDARAGEMWAGTYDILAKRVNGSCSTFL